MKRRILSLMVLFAGLLIGVVTGIRAEAASRQRLSMDSDWKFTPGDPKDAETTAFNDSGWRTLDVPHDWSIEGPFDAKSPSGRGGGYLPTGIGWYRKRFTLPPDDANRRVSIEFDGVMANSAFTSSGSVSR